MEVVVKRNFFKKMIDGWSLKDDEIEMMYLSILKWLSLSYRLRLYGEATAVVMNFDEICWFVKFAIFCVIDHPSGICGWNIDISSESKWYVIDFVSELAVSGTCVHFIDVSDLNWLLTSYLTYNIWSIWMRL